MNSQILVCPVSRDFSKTNEWQSKTLQNCLLAKVNLMYLQKNEGSYISLIEADSYVGRYFNTLFSCTHKRSWGWTIVSEGRYTCFQQAKTNSSKRIVHASMCRALFWSAWNLHYSNTMCRVQHMFSERGYIGVPCQGWALTEKGHKPPGLVSRKIYEPRPISMSSTLCAKLASPI